MGENVLLFLFSLVSFLAAHAGAQAPNLASNLTVDLGYAIYIGAHNNVTGLNVWKGIRYAAPPTGGLRWQAPQPPLTDREPILATNYGWSCPQTNPALVGTLWSARSEDCLFLNVWVPDSIKRVNSTPTSKLPVFVSIHGGGYGLGDAATDMSAFMNGNDNGFVVVTIQYRVMLSHPTTASGAAKSLIMIITVAWCVWVHVIT
jgi:hypothetical protein